MSGVGEFDEPSEEEVLDRLDGRLDGDRAAVVDAALARPDSSAARLAQWYRTFQRTAAAAPASLPPALIDRRVRRMFVERMSEQTAGVARPVWLRAELDLDSRQPEAMAAVRAPMLDTTEGVQFCFTCPVADVVLDVAPAGPGRVTIRGQLITGESVVQGALVTAHGPTGQVGTAEGDDLGGFRLDDVPVDTELITALITVTGEEFRVEVPVGEAGRPR